MRASSLDWVIIFANSPVYKSRLHSYSKNMINTLPNKVRPIKIG